MKRVLVLVFMLSCVLVIAGCSNSNTETTNRTDISFTAGELTEVGDREKIGNQIPQWVSDVYWKTPFYVVSSLDIERFNACAQKDFPNYCDAAWTQEQSDAVYLGQGIEMFVLDDAIQTNRIVYYPIILNGVIVDGYQVCEQLENQEITIQGSPHLVNQLNAMMELTSEETPLILGFNHDNTIGIIGDTYYVLDIDHMYHKEVAADKIPAIEWNACVNAMEVLCAQRTANVSDWTIIGLFTDSSVSVPGDASVFNDTEESLLDAAIKEAIFIENFGNYLPGECQGIGYKIIETFEENDILSVYALSEYVEYGFQDGVLVNISGTNPKVLMRFKRVESGNYELIFYTRLDLFSDLSEGELEQLLEPLNKAGNGYVYTDADLQEIRAQADEAAIAYLKSINRTADVGAREEHEGYLLTDFVPDADFILELTKDETYSFYPEWIGTQERLENNIRYIYQTEYDEALQQIIFSKIRFDTNEIVERQVIDIQN